jgi:hypothetical protein
MILHSSFVSVMIDNYVATAICLTSSSCWPGRNGDWQQCQFGTLTNCLSNSIPRETRASFTRCGRGTQATHWPTRPSWKALRLQRLLGHRCHAGPWPRARMDSDGLRLSAASNVTVTASVWAAQRRRWCGRHASESCQWAKMGNYHQVAKLEM